MTQPGGSATLYGVLYQLLGTAHWAAKIQLVIAGRHDTWDDARLTIEPTGGGGDTRVESAQRRIVEQWKAKSDAGSWSLARVIAGVLPDLYRAVDLSSKTPPTEYRFVTEGHRGQWALAEQFFEELTRDAVPDDPCRALDDKELFRFLPNGKLTKLGLFRHILKSLRAHADIAKEPERECAKKLWHLLSRFTMHGDRTTEAVVRELNGFLRPLVDYAEQVEQKRRELCTILLELGASGNVTFSTNELLNKAGLDNTPFYNLAKVRDALLRKTHRTLQYQWQYRPEVDVRPSSDFPTNKWVCVFAGESGQGKTWRLASMVADLLARGSMVIAISSAGDPERDLSIAADVARGALGREGPTTLDLLSKKQREFLPGLPIPWLTVCIDDVQSVAEARSLIDRDWQSLGMRLAFTALPRVASALRSQYGSEVDIVKVDEFTTLELRQYLAIHDHNWADLPADVRSFLRQPLLAKLYCDLAESDSWRPTDEYALFARYWNRLKDARNQADYPGDSTAMRDLASTFLLDDIPYPWSQSECRRRGVSPEVQKRLESLGWLRGLDDDRVEVAHDRLLNWAVAETIVAKRVSRELSLEDMAARLSKFFASPILSGCMLGYVPMDTCWIMCDPNRGVVQDLPRVILSLEDNRSLWNSERLYSNLLPTLGPGIIEAAAQRLRLECSELGTPSRDLLPAFLAKMIIGIGRQHPLDAKEWGLRLLQDTSQLLRQAAIPVLSRFPHSAALNTLWGMHKLNCEACHTKKEANCWHAREQTFAALRACIRLDPNWLEKKIVDSPEGTELFTGLAYLVATLPGALGKAVWNRVKTALFTKVPAKTPRALISCIQQHKDTAEVARLESWLEQKDDFAASVSLAALVHLAPERAIDAISRFGTNDLYVTRAWWRPGLLLRFPTETRDRIRRMIESADERWQAALVYQDDPDQMDEGTLNLLLDELQHIVSEAAGAPPKNEAVPRLWLLLSLLANVNRLQLLSQFQLRAETPLERGLTAIACSWVGRGKRSYDHELHFATAILLKISGPGVTRLINSYLSSEDKHVRLKGIELAPIRPGPETRELLEEITRLPDSGHEPEFSPLLRAKATVALAALGHNRAVVEAISRFGFVPEDLPDMLYGQPPMTDDDLSPAIKALETGDLPAQANAVFAISVSRRTDFAPMIRRLVKDAPPDSELARAAANAMGRFGDDHPDTLAFLSEQLRIPSHADAAVIALLRNGKDDSLVILERELRRSGIVAGSAVSDVLAVNLSRRRTTRRAVAEILWNSIAAAGGQWMGPTLGLLECLADLKSREVHAFLVEESHAPERGIHIVGQKADAMRGLAKLDPESAFRAVEAALHAEEKDLDLYPDLLLGIDEAKAIPVILSVYSRKLPTLGKWAIARALRHIGDRPMVRSAIDDMMSAEAPESRLLGVELASWQPPQIFGQRLRQLALNDSTPDVCRNAEKAVALIERQQAASDLLEAIETTNGERCWSYMEALVRVCDPWLLNTRDDPLYVWELLSGKPPALRMRARELVARRMEELKREAEKIDREMDH